MPALLAATSPDMLNASDIHPESSYHTPPHVSMLRELYQPADLSLFSGELQRSDGLPADDNCVPDTTEQEAHAEPSPHPSAYGLDLVDASSPLGSDTEDEELAEPVFELVAPAPLFVILPPADIREPAASSSSSSSGAQGSPSTSQTSPSILGLPRKRRLSFGDEPVSRHECGASRLMDSPPFAVMSASSMPDDEFGSVSVSSQGTEGGEAAATHDSCVVAGTVVWAEVPDDTKTLFERYFAVCVDSINDVRAASRLALASLVDIYSLATLFEGDVRHTFALMALQSTMDAFFSDEKLLEVVPLTGVVPRANAVTLGRNLLAARQHAESDAAVLLLTDVMRKYAVCFRSSEIPHVVFAQLLSLFRKSMLAVLSASEPTEFAKCVYLLMIEDNPICKWRYVVDRSPEGLPPCVRELAAALALMERSVETLI